MSHADFCFKIPDVIENDRLKLVPFDVEKHARLMCDIEPASFNYLSIGPFSSPDDFVSQFWTPLRQGLAGSFTTFAILDTTRAPGDAQFAGMSSYMNASAANLSVEIGFIVIRPEFRRSHVTTNMVGLLAKYALDTPEQGGLGVRRLEWKCSAENGPSQSVAKRMGYTYEATLRWAAAVPQSKAIGSNGKQIRKGDPLPEKLSRDTVILSISWEDWENGVREKVAEQVGRR
ncbi:acyl-CoA N-acyltransferase [Cylindrobasidium torrendii FP15055 ss-10]|uniref:Acyl-CoA N-acyltransferase n=1 Tax=Cylindrobasidium torrendii FP15055 ss-10 TaxID=1314674 RepID=A0A0D7B072_9AGAR|nr:acyl-CoA N-acyltransferase [Cylindrobasidium torrendii FP15055 ss-10]